TPQSWSSRCADLIVSRRRDHASISASCAPGWRPHFCAPRQRFDEILRLPGTGDSCNAARTVMFRSYRTQDLVMNLFSFLGSLTHAFGSLQLDDSSTSLIALLAGVIGGWRLTGWQEQLKMKRTKI